jgi:hypothetical protein
MTEHRPLIGIIDSGIDPQTPFDAARSFRLTSEGMVTAEASADAIGHATNTIRLIHSGAPQARLAIAQVFFDWVSTPQAIAAALDWLVDLNAELVNLSLGTPKHSDLLRDACARAVAAGRLLVASVPSRGPIVYPGAYPGLIRVTGDVRCQPGQFSWINSERRDLGASPLPDSRGPSNRPMAAGASCATARVSAVLAALLRDGCPPGQCVAQLAAMCAFQGPQAARAAAPLRTAGGAQDHPCAAD